MKRYLWLLLTLHGCVAPPASPPRIVVPVSAAPVTRKLVEARAAVAVVKDHVAVADSHLVTAQTETSALLLAVPEDLRPAVVTLSGDLGFARSELKVAQDRVTEADALLNAAGERLVTLQAAADAQAIEMAQVQAQEQSVRKALGSMTTERDEFRALTWKWRLLCLGGVLAVGAFFAARQYFPWLKVF